MPVTFLVPSFYNPINRTSRDTIFRFECYDKRFKVIANVTDYDSVRYYSVPKCYTDSFHTYNDAGGRKQFLPVSKIVKRYDRIGSSWMCISYPSNQYQEFNEDKNIIVRSDTLNTSDGMRIFKCYKVTEVIR